MPNIVVVGAQWGDEGKGKVVDLRAGADAPAPRTVQLGDLLADPRPHFPGIGGGHA